ARPLQRAQTERRLELRAAAEARIAPRRAFERQVIVLRRIGDAEMEANGVEERHGRQSNALRAIKVGDLEKPRRSRRARMSSIIPARPEARPRRRGPCRQA